MKIQGGGRSIKQRRGAVPPKIRAVLFVEQNPLGELANRVRELIPRLEPTLGYSLKVVDRTGRSLSSLFGQSKQVGGKSVSVQSATLRQMRRGSMCSSEEIPQAFA